MRSNRLCGCALGPALERALNRAGSRAAGDATISLRKWQKYAGDEKTFLGVVYGGDEAYEREGVMVLPWGEL